MLSCLLDHGEAYFLLLIFYWGITGGAGPVENKSYDHCMYDPPSQSIIGIVVVKEGIVVLLLPVGRISQFGVWACESTGSVRSRSQVERIGSFLRISGTNVI